MKYSDLIEGHRPDEIHSHDHLDLHMVKVLRALLKARQKDTDYFGWVGAAVMDPDHNIVFGINHKDGKGKRYHAERVAVTKYLDQYGSIPDGSIVLTTCSPCNEHMEERHGESCTEFMNRAGVKKVYCGYTDPSQTSDEPREFTLEETRNPEIRDLCKQLASNFLDAETQGVDEAFDQPYKGKWEKSEYSDSVDMLVKLPDGTPLSIMFNMEYGEDGEEVVQVEFHRNNSQEVTGEGDAQRIFATVLDAIQKYIKKYKPQRLSFSASKQVDMDADDVEHFNPESRAKLYDRLVQRYARAWGYRAFRADNGDIVIYELSRLGRGVAENFHDGKVKGKSRPGRVKRAGASCAGSVTDLRAKAKKAGGERGKMYHWCANMKSGRNKK